MRSPTGAALLLLASMVLPRPAAAQSADVAYCTKLSELALRYTGKVGHMGELSPKKETVIAVDNCKRGNTADGIPVLEKLLRDNGFTLPPR